MTEEEARFLLGLKKAIGGAWVAEYAPKTLDGLSDFHTIDTVAEALQMNRWRVRDLLVKLTKKGHLMDWTSFGLPLWRIVGAKPGFAGEDED